MGFDFCGSFEFFLLCYRYNETLDGVVLAYDPSILSNLAKILPGTFPCFGVQLKAKLLLFNPKPDMVLGNYYLRDQAKHRTSLE